MHDTNGWIDDAVLARCPVLGVFGRAYSDMTRHSITAAVHNSETQKQGAKGLRMIPNENLSRIS
jgi:hypothetical protein